MLRATLPSNQYNCQTNDTNSSPLQPSYSPSIQNGLLSAENLPTSSSSSSSPDLYLLRDSGTSSSSSFSSPASGYHGFRSEGLLHIIDDSNGHSGSARGDHGIGLETELEDGFARLLVIDQGPKETLWIGLRLSLETQADEDGQTADEMRSLNITQKTSLLAPNHLRLLDYTSATTLKPNLSFPPSPVSSSSIENTISSTAHSSSPSVPQTPFLRQVSSRSFVSTTTTTTTSCSPVQAYSSLPTTSRTSVHPWQIELANHQTGTPHKRVRAASVRSFHSSEEEQDQEDDDDDYHHHQHRLRMDKPVVDIADSFGETFHSIPRRRGHTTPLPQSAQRPEASSIHNSPDLSTRIRPGFQPLTSTSGRPLKGNKDRASGPAKSAPNSSFNLAGLNPPRPYTHRARSRCRTSSHPSPATEPVRSGGGFRQEVASLFKSFDTAATTAASASGLRSGAGHQDDPSDQTPSSSTLASDQASKMIPRTVTDLITAPVIPIAQGFTLLFISLAAVLALSTIMMGSYGLTAWDEARIRLRDLQGRVQEGTRRIGEGVREGRKLVDYAIEGARVIGSGSGVGADRFERANVNPDKFTERPRRSSFIGSSHTRDHPFEQVHTSLWNIIGQIIPIKMLGFQCTDSAMASPPEGERLRRRPSKRPAMSQKEAKAAVSKDSPLLSAFSPSASFFSPSSLPTDRADVNTFTSSGTSAWTTTSNKSSKSSFQSEIRNPLTDRSTTRTFSSPLLGSPVGSSNPSGRAPSKSQPRSKTYPQYQPKSQSQSQSQAKAKKRALPPRPPLRWLIPSIFLTLLVALGAMAYRFFGGKAEAHVGKAREREKARERA